VTHRRELAHPFAGCIGFAIAQPRRITNQQPSELRTRCQRHLVDRQVAKTRRIPPTKTEHRERLAGPGGGNAPPVARAVAVDFGTVRPRAKPNRSPSSNCEPRQLESQFLLNRDTTDELPSLSVATRRLGWRRPVALADCKSTEPVRQSSQL